MITAGIDLATEPDGTALGVIDWSPDAAVLTALHLGVDDDEILRTMSTVDKLGIDCPLGWPEDFLRFVAAHHAGNGQVPETMSGMDWRRQLAYRETDRAVRASTGRTPLSVATDRIGLTAIRAAGVLARSAAAGRPVDRAGTGVVVEVYPAASLTCWGLRSRAYKGAANRAQLAELVAIIRGTAPWLDLGAYATLCATSHDAFDAVIAGLTSRAAALGTVTAPTDERTWELARKEGWIALPTGSLASLIDR